MISTENLGLAAAMMVSGGYLVDSIEVIRAPDICRFYFKIEQEDFDTFRTKFFDSKIQVDPFVYNKKMRELKKGIHMKGTKPNEG